jgi:hypothetical protein
MMFTPYTEFGQKSGQSHIALLALVPEGDLDKTTHCDDFLGY